MRLALLRLPGFDFLADLPSIAWVSLDRVGLFKASNRWDSAAMRSQGWSIMGSGENYLPNGYLYLWKLLEWSLSFAFSARSLTLSILPCLSSRGYACMAFDSW